jgi:hypothetical protein
MPNLRETFGPASEVPRRKGKKGLEKGRMKKNDKNILLIGKEFVLLQPEKRVSYVEGLK